MAFIALTILEYWLLINSIAAEAVTEGDVGYESYDGGDYFDAYPDEDESSVLGDRIPSFDVPILNVTVVSGQTAVLPCTINNLGTNNVAWLNKFKDALTLHEQRISDDSRIDIIRPYPDEWNLQIRQVTSEDAGEYRCTVSTDPVKKKIVTLHVKVPARIYPEYSSNDVVANEYDSVRLHCNVTGLPRPDVTWFRHYVDPDGQTQVMGLEGLGEEILLRNVTRQYTGDYECVANNGVPPAQRHSIRLDVHFPPKVQVNNHRLGQHLGKDTYLVCKITGYPQRDNKWLKGDESLDGNVTPFIEEGNVLELSLHLTNIQLEDYGIYRCVAENELGSDSAETELYQYHLPDPPEPPLTVDFIRPPGNRGPTGSDSSSGHSGTKKSPSPRTGNEDESPRKGPRTSPANGSTRRTCPVHLLLTSLFLIFIVVSTV